MAASRRNRNEQNRAVLDVLTERGDALTQIREITQWAYFPNPTARATFIEQAIAAGFKLLTTMEPSDHSDKFGVILSHQDIPDQDVLDRVTALLSGLAEQSGGTYDGWETQLLGEPNSDDLD